MALVNDSYKEVPVDERAKLRELLPDGPLKTTTSLCLNRENPDARGCCRPKDHVGKLHIYADNWTSDERYAKYRWFSS